MPQRKQYGFGLVSIFYPDFNGVFAGPFIGAEAEVFGWQKCVLVEDNGIAPVCGFDANVLDDHVQKFHLQKIISDQCCFFLIF
jgi:hypothetical protein